jgi:hypothetical protein
MKTTHLKSKAKLKLQVAIFISLIAVLPGAMAIESEFEKDQQLALVEIPGAGWCEARTRCGWGRVISCTAVGDAQVICDHENKKWVRCEAYGLDGTKSVREFRCD